MIRPIRDDSDHRQALRRMSDLIDRAPEVGSDEYDELEVLGVLIAHYESKQWTPRAPTPIEAIRHHMERLGLTQTELARRANLQQPHLSAVLNGRRRLSLTQAKKLAALFEAPLGSLLLNEYDRRVGPAV